MRIVFACAGTGGHVNPAIAIANIILKREPDSKILFIGTKDGLENKLVKNAGFEIKHISSGKLLREVTLKNFQAINDTYKGIGDSKKILEEFKPDLVIGTGGYICGPVMLAARKLNIPYVLHESNAFPGLSVKLLAKNAQKVMISFEDARVRLKDRKNIIYTGTPAKFTTEEYDLLDKEKIKKEYKLDKINKKIILVACGSQGAKKVNEVVLDMVSKIQSEKYYIILVTGDRTYNDILDSKNQIEKNINKKLDDYIRIEKFIFDMDKMYKVVDMCICRGGAMTITELSIAAKPSIIIPLPTAAENHQYYNAKVLEDINAAYIIEQKNLNFYSLNDKINYIIDNNLIDKMSKNAREKVLKNVDDKIYDCIKDAVNG